MRKVGIITIFALNNHGNRLQAYASSKVLKDLNCDVVEVHYAGKGIKSIIREMIRKNRFLLWLFYFFGGIVKGHGLKNVYENCVRYDIFSSFTKKIKSRIFTGDRKDIDYYVCGSDQIWNPKFAGAPKYFAAFAPEDKRVSYAASFGVSELTGEEEARIKPCIEGMKAISVREHAGAKIVKEIAGKDAVVLTDPTLMLDKNDWQSISKKPKYKVCNRYILTYFLSRYSDDTKVYIESLAKEHGLEIINVHGFDKNKFWYYTGPSEFLWLIENASLVCTDSFHASVFSTVMETPFIVFKRNDLSNNMHSRIESLLDTLKLTDRFSDRIEIGQEFSVDYTHVPEILKEERRKAKEFLKEALDLTDGEVFYD